ncbi:MAG: ATP-binding protein [Armatimonadota bacterium]|nr:MAG: ATP-binding protein [Armatimonadota bacterium]
MSTTTASRIELKIPSRPEFISVARLAVSAVANRMGFDYDSIEDLKVATGEALTNAIQHAETCGGGGHEIVVCCVIESQSLVIEVQDTGRGFDPEVRRQALEQDELQEGGLGLLLIESLMDEVVFKTKPGKGTLVRMTKRLPAP